MQYEPTTYLLRYNQFSNILWQSSNILNIHVLNWHSNNMSDHYTFHGQRSIFFNQVMAGRTVAAATAAAAAEWSRSQPLFLSEAAGWKENWNEDGCLAAWLAGRKEGCIILGYIMFPLIPWGDSTLLVRIYLPTFLLPATSTNAPSELLLLLHVWLATQLWTCVAANLLACGQLCCSYSKSVSSFKIYFLSVHA